MCFTSENIVNNNNNNNNNNKNNDPDQARQNVGPDLGPNCLQTLSVDNKSHP